MDYKLKEFLKKNKELIEDKNIIDLLRNATHQLYTDEIPKLFLLLNRMEEQKLYTPTKWVIWGYHYQTSVSWLIKKDGSAVYTFREAQQFNTKEEAEEKIDILKSYLRANNWDYHTLGI